MEILRCTPPSYWQPGLTRQAAQAQSGPPAKSRFDAALAVLAGSLLNQLAGRAEVAAGASARGLAGLVFDLATAGVGLDFLSEVSQALAPARPSCSLRWRRPGQRRQICDFGNWAGSSSGATAPRSSRIG